MMSTANEQHAEAIIDAALAELATVLHEASVSGPTDQAIRAMEDTALLIVHAAREARREAAGIAAHMFCNYLQGQSATAAWNAGHAGLHYDAMRRLCSDLDRPTADSILQGLLKLSQPQSATST